MNTVIPFTKVVGAGNDFVIVDDRRSRLRQLPRLARAMCDRRRGIGADGLLVAARARRGDIRMRIFNPDGSEPEMCGNGARCFALYAHQRGFARRRLQLETRAGTLGAEVLNGSRVRLEMPRPRQLRQESLRVGARTRRIYRASVGNPHVVIVVRDIARAPVVTLGRAIRRHRRFAPAGTNVNFVQPGRAVSQLRTYERGVEDETPACGTGATATAAVLAVYRRARSPVTLRVRSGDCLHVSFAIRNDVIQRAWLEGPARIVYTGTFVRGGRHR